MQSVLLWLQGKKTYITVIVAVIFNAGVAFKLWNVDNATWAAIDTILGALGLGFLRAGIAKPADDPPKPPQPPPPGKPEDTKVV